MKLIWLAGGQIARIDSTQIQTHSLSRYVKANGSSRSPLTGRVLIWSYFCCLLTSVWSFVHLKIQILCRHQRSLWGGNTINSVCSQRRRLVWAPYIGSLRLALMVHWYSLALLLRQRAGPSNISGHRPGRFWHRRSPRHLCECLPMLALAPLALGFIPIRVRQPNHTESNPVVRIIPPCLPLLLTRCSVGQPKLESTLMGQISSMTCGVHLDLNIRTNI